MNTSKRPLSMIQFFSIFILFTFISSNISAQTPEVDSLKTLLEKHADEDSLRVNLLNETSAKMFRVNMQEALDLAKEAKEIADEIGFTHGKAESRKNIAFYHINRGEFNQSTKYYLEAKDFYEAIGNKARVALCYNNIGIMQRIQGDYDKSIETHKKALEIRSQIDDKFGISSSLTNIGVLHYSLGEFSKALEYYENALQVNEEVGDKGLITKALTNIGVVYEKQGELSRSLEYYHRSLDICEEIGDKRQAASCLINIGVIYYRQEDLLKALEYYNKALVIEKELENKKEIASILNNIGIVYEHQKEFDEALAYHQQSLEIRKEMADKKGIAGSYNNIASIYKNKKEYKEAAEYYSDALKIAEEIGAKESICKNLYMLAYIRLKQKNYTTAYNLSRKAYKLAQEIEGVSVLKESADILSQASAALGRYKEAYETHQVFKNMADSLINESTIKEITNLENQYNFEKEKQAIESEQQKKEAILKEENRRKRMERNVFIAGFLFVLLSAIIISRLYRKTKKANIRLIEQNAIILKQKEEKEMLVKEIHHRTKNNLQIISSLFDLQMRTTDNEETKAALIDGLNRVKSVGLIHQLLYQSEDVINIGFEDFVKKLMEHITSFSSDKPIKQSISIPENLHFDINTTLPLGLIINELMTNAFKYAFENVESCIVSVMLEKHDDKYHLEIKDNGMGLPEKFDFQTSKSLGLRLVRTLSEQLKGTIKYEFVEGAKFILIFPDQK